MPMIDVYLPDDVLPDGADADLTTQLTHAVLRAEGVTAPGAFHLDNTAAFVHRLAPQAVGTAGAARARAVRVQVITPPGSLDREGQRQIVREATDIVAGTVATDVRTWVILTEAAEGGWGIAGTAFGIEEFTELAARVRAAT